MQMQVSDIVTILPSNLPKAAFVEDYSQILSQHFIDYRSAGYHWQVGEITGAQGWLLHISVVRSHFEQLMEAILLTLTSTRVPFKLPKNKETARSILDGNLGHSQVGKVITIYPETVELAVFLAKQLIPLTKCFRGPKVLSAFHLGGRIYTEHGGFNPVIISDVSGKESKFIYNQTGELIPDIPTIPFALPPGINWPFSSISDFTINPERSILHGIYKPVQILKSDPKGNVYKALRTQNVFFLSWCVIKQGVRDMWSDDDARDITDRLLWQQELHNKLSDSIPLPRIFDLFVENYDTYLVMEYIKGPSLYAKILSLNKNATVWPELPVKTQITILHYLLQLLQIIANFHELKYIHRDITPVNFIVDKKDKLSVIDIELSYSIADQKPLPPFESGTHGFMSPAQFAVCTPSTEDDIYALGATIITLLVGVSPLMIDIRDQARLKNNLYFFLKDGNLAEIIARALAIDPTKRPPLRELQTTIKNNLQSKKTEQSSVAGFDHHKYLEPSTTNIRGFINKAIVGLTTEPTIISNGLWYSRTAYHETIQGKQKSEFEKSVGLAEGMAGILYCMSAAKKLGFDTNSCQKMIENSWLYIKNTFLNALPDIPPGLYGGGAGISLAIMTGMEAKMLPDTPENRFYLQECLALASVGLDIESGSAGQGIAALQVVSYIESGVLRSILEKHAQILIDAQQKSEYWVMVTDKRKKALPATSLSYGNTGITWFLLEFATRYNHNAARLAAIRALNKLTKSVSYLKRLLLSKGSRSFFGEDLIIWDGIQGMILVFLKAYETIGDRAYRRIAEELLLSYPPLIIHDNLNQDTGLSGLGELYLEAHRVLQAEEWLERAKWIVRLLTHTCIYGNNESCHWLSNNQLYPTADFLAGNSGIIHFLMRYLYPKNVGYRLLNSINSTTSGL